MKPFHRQMTERSPMYIYATEMVSSYYGRLNLEGKRVLSIVGSGDQIINAYFFGAKEVIGFDINRYALFMLNLKFSALNELSYDEFLRFFGSDLSNGDFNFVLYKKMRKRLSLKTTSYFDKIYREFKNNGKRLIKSDHFRQRDMIKCSASRINHYLRSEQDYLRCRAIVQNKEINFLTLDINDILSEKRLKDKFDIINLSNVPNYLTGNIKEGDLVKVLADVTNKVSKLIKKTGAFFYYSYSPSIYSHSNKKIPPASSLSLIREIKRINNFKTSTKIFKGVSHGTFDRINVFRV